MAAPAKAPNAKQRAARWIGLFILLLVGVFPPWKGSYSADGTQVSTRAGYHPIWNPPSSEQDVPDNATALAYQVDLKRIAVQFAVVLFLINGGYFLLRSKVH
jgi:hypothetical protein